jgi:hypothetical protein
MSAFLVASRSPMLGVPRLRASTLMCDNGVWNSPVMMAAVAEMSFGTASSTMMSLIDTYSVASCSAFISFTVPTASPTLSGW